MGWSWQNSPSNSFENISRCWNGSTRWKIFPWMRKRPLFCSRFNTNPPLKTRNRQTIKIKTVSRKHSSEIDVILAWAAATSCHSSCHRYAALWWTLLSLDQSGVAVAGATNSVNARQSEAVTVSLFFPPPHPTLLAPPPLPKGILYSPQFRSHQETTMAARRTERSTSTISRKNRGLWTV